MKQDKREEHNDKWGKSVRELFDGGMHIIYEDGIHCYAAGGLRDNEPPIAEAIRALPGDFSCSENTLMSTEDWPFEDFRQMNGLLLVVSIALKGFKGGDIARCQRDAPEPTPSLTPDHLYRPTFVVAAGYDERHPRELFDETVSGIGMVLSEPRLNDGQLATIASNYVEAFRRYQHIHTASSD